MEKILVDTDIVVDFLRGFASAVDFIKEHTGVILLSTITHAELFTGARNKREEEIIQSLLVALPQVEVNAAIARDAGALKRQYGLSHGMGLADAIIAASARSLSVKLASLNRKHFSMLENLVVPYQK